MSKFEKDKVSFPLTKGIAWLLIDLPRQIQQILLNQRTIMALNAEVLAFAERVDAATNDIAADIQLILNNPANTLSEEDRARLEASVSALEALASER